MNKITQYFPGFMDFTPEIIQFNTTEELLNIPWVKGRSEKDGFEYYCIYNLPGQINLMAYDVGPGRMIGYLDHDIPELRRFPE